MIVDKIVINNIKLLEEAYKNATNGEIKKDFGRRLPVLLDHISVVLNIRDVSLLEAMMLKKFSNSDIIEYTDTISEYKPNVKFKNMDTYINELDMLNTRIKNDTDVKVKPDSLIFPVYKVKKSLTLTFSGLSLLNIIGPIDNLPTCIFKAITDGNYDTFIITYFLREFYNFMDNQLQYIDLASDSTLHNKYLNAIEKKDKIILSQINTNFGSIDFFDQKNFGDSLSKIKSNRSTISDDNYNLYELDYLDSIFFTCNTSLYTFFEIFLNSPIGSVLEYTDFKIIFSNNTDFVTYKDIETYNRRLVNLYKLIHKERTSSQTNDTRIDKFNYMILSQNINYTLKIKFSDLDKFIKLMERYIEKEFVRTNYNYTYSYKEIKEIVEFIKKSSLAIYSNLKK